MRGGSTSQPTPGVWQSLNFKTLLRSLWISNPLMWYLITNHLHNLVHFHLVQESWKLISRWTGKVSCRKTRSISGCSEILFSVTTWPDTEKILSTGTQVGDIPRYLHSVWDKYGNVEVYFFHHNRGFSSTGRSPSIHYWPTRSLYVSTSSFDRTLSSYLHTTVGSLLWRHTCRSVRDVSGNENNGSLLLVLHTLPDFLVVI